MNSNFSDSFAYKKCKSMQHSVTNSHMPSAIHQLQESIYSSKDTTSGTAVWLGSHNHHLLAHTTMPTSLKLLPPSPILCQDSLASLPLFGHHYFQASTGRLSSESGLVELVPSESLESVPHTFPSTTFPLFSFALHSFFLFPGGSYSSTLQIHFQAFFPPFLPVHSSQALRLFWWITFSPPKAWVVVSYLGYTGS